MTPCRVTEADGEILLTGERSVSSLELFTQFRSCGGGVDIDDKGNLCGIRMHVVDTNGCSDGGLGVLTDAVVPLVLLDAVPDEFESE